MSAHMAVASPATTRASRKNSPLLVHPYCLKCGGQKLTIAHATARVEHRVKGERHCAFHLDYPSRASTDARMPGGSALSAFTPYRRHTFRMARSRSPAALAMARSIG